MSHAPSGLTRHAVRQSLGLRFAGALALTLPFVCLSACSEPTVALDILAYNHGPNYIYTFDVNGAMGPNLGPVLAGEKFSGGGKSSCCVVLPAKWRPDLKAYITWFYDQAQTDPNPIPPPREADVEIPPYGPNPRNGDYGAFFVHFYPDNQIRIVVSPFFPEHEKAPNPDLSPVATGTLLKDEQPKGEQK